jgi:allantoin racemase
MWGFSGACVPSRPPVLEKQKAIDAPVRILAIDPVTSDDPGTKGIYLSESPDFLTPGTVLEHIHVSRGLKHIENPEDAEHMAPIVAETAIWAQNNHYDAVVIKCMLNPAIREAQQSVTIPVVGPRGASLEVARKLGRNPAYIYPMGIMVKDLKKNPARTYQVLLKEAKRAVAEGADVLIIGCTVIEAMAYPLREDIDVPVLRNVHHAIRKADRLSRED